MMSPDNLRLNGLISALPEVERDRWLPHLATVKMPLGHVLHESGITSSHVYFPTTAIVCLLYVMENGTSAEGVTEAALKLQQLGLIRYARGRITVLDRGGLEERTCECYGVVKKEYDRLLPPGLSAAGI